MFKLDEVLKNDSYFVEDLNFCRLLLMNNAHYPWFILVPRQENLVELTDLSFKQQIQVLNEINLIAKILHDKYSCYKLNIAALGNVVRQLHIHIIARFKDDISFPKPVFGGAQKNYDEKEAQNLINEIKELIANENLLKKQVLYRSIHRGCKETDHIIGNFAKENIENFDKDKLLLFKEFIKEDDLLIYDWVLNKLPAYKKYQDLVLEIQKFHAI